MRTTCIMSFSVFLYAEIVVVVNLISILRSLNPYLRLLVLLGAMLWDQDLLKLFGNNV